MSDGDDGSRPTRRRVLAGVAGTAGLGLVGGAGTRAFLQDTEVVPGSALGNSYEGTHLDLRLHCPESHGACSPSGDGVSFAFPDVEPGDDGATTVCLGLDGEPAWLWLRTTPPVDRLVADELTVTFAFDDGTPVRDPDGETIEDRPLNDLLGAFANGGAVPGEGPKEAFTSGEERCLELSWSLPDDPDLSGQSVEFTLQFAAVQYRADAAASNPWGQQ